MQIIPIPDRSIHPTLKWINDVKPGEFFRLKDVYGLYGEPNEILGLYFRVDTDLCNSLGREIQCVNMEPNKNYLTDISPDISFCCEVISFEEAFRLLNEWSHK